MLELRKPTTSADGGQHQRPVRARNVDLADLARRRVDDLDARQEAELHRLAGEREDAGDHRLRGDDRRHGGEHDQRVQRPRRGQAVEGIVGGRRVVRAAAPLAEVVEQQRRRHHAEPVDLDRPLAEVAEIGIQRLASGGDQEDRAEDQVAGHTVAGEEAHGVKRD